MEDVLGNTPTYRPTGNTRARALLHGFALGLDQENTDGGTLHEGMNPMIDEDGRLGRLIGDLYEPDLSTLSSILPDPSDGEQRRIAFDAALDAYTAHIFVLNSRLTDTRTSANFNRTTGDPAYEFAPSTPEAEEAEQHTSEAITSPSPDPSNESSSDSTEVHTGTIMEDRCEAHAAEMRRLYYETDYEVPAEYGIADGPAQGYPQLQVAPQPDYDPREPPEDRFLSSRT
ncbi:hypothetical protein WAI453_006174 [Rhynchosporium graminicola]|uniref:Uncharacterized protein n=1 Tax=Rhynchosporium graminicola TaxID=2792576 RepID=A0A1E1LS77_9HELO|nr:uncharacterized protein RCO7_03402 [Rhynchosporium commune]